MELITTSLCKASDIGAHNYMFGGHMMALIDEASAAYAMEICDTPNIVTVKVDELIFKQAVKLGNLIKIYGEIKEIGRTSITLYIEVRIHDVYDDLQVTATHTNIKFVKIDPISRHAVPIDEQIKLKYKK